jgi:glycosyltransferase involved in cell wall biosynthesis
MKILSLSASVFLEPHLGSGKTRLRWTSGLRELGHEVDVLQPSDVEIWPGLKMGRRYRIALGTLLKARKLINKNKYDLMEFYGDEYWLLLWWLKKIKRNPPLLVAHVDGLELYDKEKELRFWGNPAGIKKWMFKFNENLSAINFRLADKFICGCDDELKYVVKKNLFTPGNAACISPGIDDEYHELPFCREKTKNIIFFGSWIDRKGVKVIPEVITQVLEKNPDFCFEIFGSWSSRDLILSGFRKELHPRIKIYNKLPVNELIGKLRHSSVFFFPTYSEGFGLATLEAMSCSIAVVTTPTGIGCNLENNVEAKICDFNDVHEMSGAIDQIIKDDGLRARIAYNGFQFAKKYVWKKQVLMLEQKYQQWLS